MSKQADSVLGTVLRLLRPFWLITLLATMVGALAGLTTAWLLATVNRGLQSGNGVSLALVLQFIALCVLSIGGSLAAGVGNSIIGQKIIAALRKDISGRILRAPITAIEQQRAYRLMAVLTNDVDNVSAFTFNFAGYVVALTVVLGAIMYLLLLSPLVFLLVLAATALGVGINIFAKRGWIKDYENVRTATDDLLKQYRAITDGAKELRLNRARRQRVHEVLLGDAADRIAASKIHAMRGFWFADSAGSAIFFAVIGLLLAARHMLGLEAAVISGTVLVLLYVKGPVEQIANGLPAFGQAQVALRRIALLSTDFTSQDKLAGQAVVLEFNHTIELRDACYEFSGGFILGPVNLTLSRGEILFIVGENGSGKTTLIKLLLGLYRPSSGALLLDGVAVPEARMDDYRQLFSAVFSDYFLFDDLIGAGPDFADQANEYLDRLEISQKVKVGNGAFTTTDLSTGQKKRLALVHAYLEQRPIMMFDEWAADQDPTFRRVFYSEILPDLQRRGKSLIVVSHDDRYFDAADRVVRLDAGKIVEDRVVASPINAAPGHA